MRKKISILLILCIFTTLILFGCSQTAESSVSKTDFYFHTIIKITLYGTRDEAPIDECFALAKKFEELFSTSIETSEISQINSLAGTGEYTPVSQETLELLQAGIHYGKLSDGKFDITVGALSSLWNISEISSTLESDTNETNASVIPDKNEIVNLLFHVDYNKIHIDGNKVYLEDPDAQIDLGGIAKGYAADKMKAYLNQKGYTEGIINLGGNVLTLGEKTSQEPYSIGIQKPFSATGEVLGVVKTQDSSVVTSGIYERYYRVDEKIYHHILDLDTGYPCDNGLYEVTIISSSSMDGDALSTTCFALGLEAGMQLIESIENAEAIFVTDDLKILTSSGIGEKIQFEQK